MEITLQQIAEITGGTIKGDPETRIHNLAGIEEAGEGDLTFIANPKYAKHIDSTNASAVICSPDVTSETRNLLLVDNPYLAYAKLISCFNPPPAEPCTVDERAVVGEKVTLGKNVTIYPLVYIGDNCTIADGVTVYPNSFIGNGVTIGEDTFIHPNVTVREGCIIGKRVIIHSGTVIGCDGFGFAQDGDRHYKIPQLGIVQIDDDVEIGSGNTIDRAVMDRTWIKRGTKTDNLVHIAHNVTIGEDSLLVAQVGISGSTRVGNRVTLAGQAATVGHITIGDDVIIAARGAASSDIPSGKQVYSGAPHMPHKTWLKATSTFPKLPEMRKKITELEKKLAQLEDALHNNRGG